MNGKIFNLANPVLDIHTYIHTLNTHIKYLFRQVRSGHHHRTDDAISKVQSEISNP